MKKLIMANWKMQLNYQASLGLAKKFGQQIKTSAKEVVICPDYLSLVAVSNTIKKTKLILGAQDCSITERGAYTGEVSPADLKSLGVRYVILGHSERRSNWQENSQMINNKIKAALASKLIPVLCIGETLVEKQRKQTKNVLIRQLRQELKEVTIKTAQDIVISYEPVWAISTNKAAQPMLPSEADEIQEFISHQAVKILRKKVRIIYGGSADFNNASEFLRQKNIAGLLVGGASLKIKNFIEICK